MIIRAFPEGQILNPEGIDELGFTKDFSITKSRVSLDFDELVLVNEDYKRLNQWIYEQQGRFENVEASTESLSGNVYPHYLDLSTLKITDTRMSLSIQARKGTDHFFDNADVLIWQVIRDSGFLPNTLIKDVPFVIVPANLKMAQAVAVVTTITLLDQFNRAFFELQKLLADGLDVVGTGILTAIAKAVAVVIHFAIVAIALVQSFQTLKELYFPTLRFYSAVSDYDLIKQGCEYLGYTLESDVLSNLQQIHTMGRPLAVENKSFLDFLPNQNPGFLNKGYPTSQDTTPTLWSLIQHYLDNYNWRIFVYDGIVKLEPKAFFMGTASITIKPAYSDQENRETVSEFDNSKVWGRSYTHWQTDFSDIHSPDSSQGSQSEYISVSQNALNPDLVSLKGLSDQTLNFAWGGRKEGLTAVEKIILGIFQFVDAVIDVFGGSSDFASTVEKRIGVMMIEKEYFEVTKKLWLVLENNLWKQPSNYKDELSADKIHTDFRTDLEIPNNNFTTVEMRVPFTDEKFQTLLQNNFVFLPNGDIIEVEFVDWKDRKHAAIFRMLFPDTSAFNVETIKIT